MRTRRRRLRRLAHGRGRDRRARARAALLQRAALQRRREDRGRRRPVLVPVPRGRRRPRRPLHLPARRRPLPDRHQRRQPRDRLRVDRASTPRLRRRGPRRRRRATRCSPSRARTRASSSRGARRRRAAAADATSPTLDDRRRRRRSSAAPATPARTASSCCSTPTSRPASGTRCSTPASSPAGLGARDTLRLEVCFHLYGNDLTPTATRSRPASAGAARRTRASSAPRRSPESAPTGPAERLAPFVLTERGHPAPGQPDPRAATSAVGEVTSGTHSPSLEIGIGMGYVRADLAEPAPSSRSTCAASAAPARVESKPLYRRRERAELGRRELSRRASATTPSTTGPGSRATRATFGITWYAQDALGEVVFYDPPEVGAEVTKDTPYAEVESVKAVSDVYAPLSGEIIEVNEALGDSPETINEDPYGEGWLVKVKLSDPVGGRRPAGRRRLPQAARGELSPPTVAVSRYTSATDADRARDARGDRRRRRSTSCSSRSRPLRLDRAARRCRPGLGEAEVYERLRRARASETPTPSRELCFIGAGMYDHYVPAIVDAITPALGVPDPLHALPARDLAGRRCRRCSSSRPRCRS